MVGSAIKKCAGASDSVHAPLSLLTSFFPPEQKQALAILAKLAAACGWDKIEKNGTILGFIDNDKATPGLVIFKQGNEAAPVRAS